MRSLRLFAALLFVSLLPGVVLGAESFSEKKPPVIQRSFEFPLDFKTRADFQIGDPSSIPLGVMPNYSVEAKRPFVGFGFTQPLVSGK